MKTILITGCNRGIGFGLVKHLCEKYGQMENIFATCRNPQNAQELTTLAKNNPNVKILKADFNSNEDITNLAQTVTNILGTRGLDVLINNAGISSKFTRLQLVKEKDLTDHFRINVIAPILLAKHLLPVLKNGRNEGGSSGIIVNMSSILGSIQENTTGGFYPYRTSKAAINAATRSMSLDLREQNIVAVALHPGWIKTDMGGKQAPITVEEGSANLINLIRNISIEHNGLFLTHEGKQLPW